MAKYASYLGVAMTFAVISGPVLGGYLHEFLGWRFDFIFLVIYGLLLLWSVLFVLKETNAYRNKNRLSAKFCVDSFKQLLCSRIFISYSICVFLTYGAFFSWIIVAPILLINVMGLGPITVGWVVLILGAFSMPLSSFIHGKMIIKFGRDTMLYLGWGIMFFSGVLMFALSFISTTNLFFIIVPAYVFLFGTAWIWPNCFVGAFEPFGHIAGYAASLYSFMQLGGGAIIGLIVAFLPDNDVKPIALLFIIISSVTLIIFHKIIQK